MLYKKFNIWYLNSFLISAIVAIPIVTVFSSFFESTGRRGFSSLKEVELKSGKTIKKIEVKKIKDIIYIKVIAKSFLMSQVRIIAGTLVEIGLKKKTEENIIKALKNGKRSLAGPTAPAHALVLEKIIY